MKNDEQNGINKMYLFLININVQLWFFASKLLWVYNNLLVLHLCNSGYLASSISCVFIIACWKCINLLGQEPCGGDNYVLSAMNKCQP